MSDYTEELKKRYTLRLRGYLAELPAFCGEYIRAIQDNTAIRTRIAYTFDLRLFFRFLTEQRDNFKGKDIAGLTIDDLLKVSVDDIEAFMDFLSYYIKSDGENVFEIQNAEEGKSRKLAAVKGLFAYFHKKRRLPANPSALIEFPRLFEKAIIRLEVDEVAKLLDVVESGDKLTKHQQKYHNRTKLRDLAIFTLLLGTGIRLSECIGIDISHIDFDVSGVKITRKGGNEAIVYFGDEVGEALMLYLEERLLADAAPGHENALFLSLQNKRITDRAVQNLVKKYSKIITGLKNITPHKLRSTFGTALYRETGDIYLVADVLGHSDVNTTRKHYAAIDENARRRAAKQVKLRKEGTLYNND